MLLKNNTFPVTRYRQFRSWKVNYPKIMNYNHASVRWLVWIHIYLLQFSIDENIRFWVVFCSSLLYCVDSCFEFYVFLYLLEGVELEFFVWWSHSGCITSAETVMLEKQSLDEFLSSIDKGKIVIVSLSPQSRASLAEYFGLSPLQVWNT